MTFCSCTSKAFLCIISLVLWVCAAVLTVFAVSVYAAHNDFGEITSDTYSLVPATILLAAAVLIFILGVIGLVGAFKEQKCLLGIFATVLLFIFIAVVSAAVLAYVYRNRIADTVSAGIKEAIQQYGNDSLITEDVDLMQSDLHCCGFHNYTDWLDTPWHQENGTYPYPESCCKDKLCSYDVDSSNHTELYTQGCYDKLKDGFMSNLATIASVAAVFAVIQLLGMIAACVLICRGKTTAPYLQFDTPGGMRV